MLNAARYTAPVREIVYIGEATVLHFRTYWMKYKMVEDSHTVLFFLIRSISFFILVLGF
jgi:hypothetical protein